MKAAVLYGPGDIRLEDVPVPSIASNEVLIKTLSCGVCGSDVHMYDGHSPEGSFPLIPGHEWVGEIVEVGSAVDDFQLGDRVVGQCSVGCHACSSCKGGKIPELCKVVKEYGFSVNTPGAFAEYHASLTEPLRKVPDSLSLEEATLTEAVSVPYHTIWGVCGGVAAHDRVVVFGAGPIGLLGMMSAKAAGAPVIQVEPHAYRRDLAERLGADVVIDPSTEDVVGAVFDETGGEGATLILECSGDDQALAEMMDCSAVAGRIGLIGHSAGRKVPIEIGKAIIKCLRIFGNRGAPYFFGDTLAFMSQRLVDISSVLTHRMPLEQIGDALELGVSRDCGKIMITF